MEENHNNLKTSSVESITKQFRANHLLGLYRMDALTELKHIGLGGFSPHITIPRFPLPTGWWIYLHFNTGII
jgi:hypothetical protein